MKVGLGKAHSLDCAYRPLTAYRSSYCQFRTATELVEIHLVKWLFKN